MWMVGSAETGQGEPGKYFVGGWSTQLNGRLRNDMWDYFEFAASPNDNGDRMTEMMVKDGWAIYMVTRFSDRTVKTITYRRRKSDRPK